jgi:PAS domain S-box-containing protein
MTIMVCVPVAFLIAELGAMGALYVHTQEVSASFVRSKSVLLRYQLLTSSVFSAVLKILSTAVPTAPVLDFQSLENEIARNQSEVLSGSDLRPEVSYALKEAPEVFAKVLRLVKRAEAVSRDRSIPPRKRVTAIGDELMIVVPELQSLSARMSAAESHLKVSAPAEIAKLRTWIITGTVACTLLTALTSVLMASAFLRNIRSRLQIIEDNAASIAIRKALSPHLEGNDELTELDSAVHQTAALIVDKQNRELAILNKSVDVLCSIDKQLRFTALGDSARSAWHHKPDDLLGLSILTLMPEDDAAKLAISLEKLQPGTETDFETIINCGDGKQKDFFWKISKTDHNTYYCVARDITEKRAVARTKQRLIAVAGHDVRTPLSSISSAISLLQEGAYGELAPGSAEILKKTEANLERLMDLIRDLLELEKLESGKFSLQLACVSALDVCVLAKQAVSQLAEKAQVKIVSSAGDASINADERRVVQILINFVAQAISNTVPGGTVSLSITPGEKFVEFSIVADDPGIPDVDRDLFFERFYKPHSNREQRSDLSASSNGLAMTIAKALTQSHGGAVGLENKIAPPGCRFWFTIPNFEAPDDIEG